MDLSVCKCFLDIFFSFEKYTLVIVVVVLRYDTKSKWHYNTELNIIQFYYVQFFLCSRPRTSFLLCHLRSFPLLLLMALAVHVSKPLWRRHVETINTAKANKDTYIYGLRSHDAKWEKQNKAKNVNSIQSYCTHEHRAGVRRKQSTLSLPNIKWNVYLQKEQSNCMQCANRRMAGTFDGYTVQCYRYSKGSIHCAYVRQTKFRLFSLFCL